MRVPRPSEGSRLLWGLALLTLVLVAHAFPFLKFHQGDADRYLIPWYDHIVEAGRIRAFSHPFSDYTPTYLYLLSMASLLDGCLEPLIVIKLLAWVGALWMAFSIGRLLAVLHSRHVIEGAIASLLLPSIILNVSVFGQADTFWVAACVLALTRAIEGRPGAVAFWSGVAFAFKAQAIFFAPFVFLLFLARKAPRWCWLVPPAVYVAAMFPAWFMGWPALNLLTIYFRQAQWQPELRGVFISDGASWWTLYGFFFPQLALRTFWFGYFTTALATLGYLAVLSKRQLTSNMLVGAAALSAAGLPFLLPGMHERFFILADVLTFCLAFADPRPKTIATAILMQLASCVPGYGWALGLRLLRLPGCFFGLGALILLIDYLSRTRAEPSRGFDPHNLDNQTVSEQRNSASLCRAASSRSSRDSH